MRRIFANVSSSWPTVRHNERGQWQRDHGEEGQERLTLNGASQQWPTPVQADGERSTTYNERGNPTLVGEASQWQTPAASMHHTHHSGDLSKTYDLLPKQAQNWPTARAEDGESAGNHPNATDSLTGAVRNWPTPSTAPEAPNTNSNTVNGPTSLGEAATLWQTPGTDSFRSRGGERKDEQGLDQMARTWATPRTNAAKGAWDGHDGGDDLQTMTRDWRTPSSRDWKGESAKSWQGREDKDPTPTLVDQVALSPLAQAMQTDGSDGLQTGRVLNPRFVEALMGWPSGATDYESSVTEWSLWRLQMRCVLSLLGWE